MPELPEIETIVRGLQYAVGSRVEKLQIIDPSISLPTKRIIGQEITAIYRRGKYIVIKLSSGGALIFHLRMSGKLLRVCPPEEGKYSRLALHLDNGVIRFVNPRRLGTVEFAENGFPHALGIDPLSPEFTAKRLGEILQKSHALIKSLLMDQRKIVGLGNIYSAEALWRAGIDPRRRADAINPKETCALRKAIVSVLREAIDHMGTTFSDYRTVDGEEGGFQAFLSVYGKEGKPCPRCGAEIVRIKQAGRMTYFCPACQR